MIQRYITIQCEVLGCTAHFPQKPTALNYNLTTTMVRKAASQQGWRHVIHRTGTRPYPSDDYCPKHVGR